MREQKKGEEREQNRKKYNSNGVKQQNKQLDEH